MEYLTTRETAEFLDVPKGTLDRWATSTEINKKIFPADDKDIRNGLKVNLFSKDRIVALKEFAGGQKITAEIVKNFNKRNDTTADFNFVDSAQIVIDTLLEYDKPDELIIAELIIADSVTFISTTFDNDESTEKVFTLDSEPSTSLAVISADSVIDIPAEKDRAENDKTARAMAVADSLEIALGQLRRVFDDNLPAELDDIFKTLKEQISLIRRFLTSQD